MQVLDTYGRASSPELKNRLEVSNSGGQPLHLILRDSALKDAGVLLSWVSFTLYSDMSSQMMSITARLGPEQEIYLINESFVRVAGMVGSR